MIQFKSAPAVAQDINFQNAIRYRLYNPTDSDVFTNIMVANNNTDDILVALAPASVKTTTDAVQHITTLANNCTLAQLVSNTTTMFEEIITSANNPANVGLYDPTIGGHVDYVSMSHDGTFPSFQVNSTLADASDLEKEFTSMAAQQTTNTNATASGSANSPAPIQRLLLTNYNSSSFIKLKDYVNAKSNNWLVSASYNAKTISIQFNDQDSITALNQLNTHLKALKEWK